MEIAAYQPELDFPAGDDQPRPESTLVPVAPLRLRCRAGLLDAAFLLVTYAGFIGLFTLLGGHLFFGKLDAAIYAAAFLLFYAQYFVLFTAFGGSTPGMQLCGLYVLSFDGNPATIRQLLWRSFGYVVAGGAALLGFLWSLWDEDHLTWQDRISQTYITQISEPAETEEA